MTDSSKFHAYTDGTDWIIGTSLEEAIAAYAEEIDASVDDFVASSFKLLDSDKDLTICERDEPGQPKETKKVSEWIAERISNHGEHLSRLLCSTEY